MGEDARLHRHAPHRRCGQLTRCGAQGAPWRSITAGGAAEGDGDGIVRGQRAPRSVRIVECRRGEGGAQIGGEPPDMRGLFAGGERRGDRLAQRCRRAEAARRVASSATQINSTGRRAISALMPSKPVLPRMAGSIWASGATRISATPVAPAEADTTGGGLTLASPTPDTRRTAREPRARAGAPTSPSAPRLAFRRKRAWRRRWGSERCSVRT